MYVLQSVAKNFSETIKKLFGSRIFFTLTGAYLIAIAIKITPQHF